MRRFTWLFLIPTLLCSDWPWQENWCCSGQWSPSLETIGQAGNFRKGGGALVFSPIGQSCGSIFFGQAHAGVFRELYAGSLGLGYRCQAEPGQYSWGHYFAWGINGFFDIARSNSKRVYYQGSVGGEVLGDCWLFRANGYWPSRSRHVLSTRRVSTVFVDGTNIIATDDFFDTVEQGYHGFDLEVGAGREIGCGQLWGYAGYYHFTGSRASSQQGPRLRLDYTLDQAFCWCPLELRAGGEWSQDQVHGSTVSGYISLRIPFCNTRRSSSCCDGICRLMGDPVYRNKAIWVDRDERLSDWPITSQIGRIFFADGTGGGTGIQSAPATIDAAFGLATAPDDIIFCLPDNGFLASSANTLLAGQQLVGFGTSGQAEIPVDGRTLVVRPISTNGNAATVRDASGGNMITLEGANANHRVDGLILDGFSQAGDNAIVSGDVVSLQVCDVVIRDFSDGAINDLGTDPFLDVAVKRSTFDRVTPGAGTGINLLGSQIQPLALSVKNSTISRFDVGIGVDRIGRVNFVCRGCSLAESAGAIGIDVIAMSNGGNVLIDASTIDYSLTGIAFFNPLLTGAQPRIAILNNSIGQVTIPTNGINNVLTGPGSDGVTRQEIVIARNAISGQPAAVDVNNALLDSRGFLAENALTGDVNFTPASGTVSWTIRNNTNTAAFNTDLSCTTFDGNTGTLGSLTSTPALTNLQTLGPLNNGMPFTTAGSSDSVIPCALP